MKLFKCQACGQTLFFENRVCLQCGHRLAFLSDSLEMSAVEPEGERWTPLARPEKSAFFCANAELDACNWLVPPGSQSVYCDACRHNRTVPNFGDEINVARWRKLEIAKHRLFYSLLRLTLPHPDRTEDPQNGLAFDFLDDAVEPVMTGHADGLITINLREADDAQREQMRGQMGESYRTLLGHFRHEIGHYYWDRLVRDGPELEMFRSLFGDERADYASALKAHYENGSPADWQDDFISSYATAHPWEDWAETFAHYIHIVDTLETASAFGIRLGASMPVDGLSASIDFDPYHATDIADLIAAWVPLTFAVNSINRSMGQPDLYPFVLSPGVIRKLGFVHRLIRVSGASAGH